MIVNDSCGGNIVNVNQHPFPKRINRLRKNVIWLFDTANLGEFIVRDNMDPKCQSDADVEGYNRKCLQIVQKYIEIFYDSNDKHSLEDFLEDCHFITRAHFEDIVEERACSDLCGYVLCNNQLTETSRKQFKLGQKYHIHKNIVYDITRRKNFCSNHCFQCAESLRSQISTEPLFLRKNDNKSTTTKKIELLQDQTRTSGQFGDIIPLKDPLDNVTKSKSKNDQQKRTNNAAQQSIKNQILKNEKLVETKLSAPYLKEEEFNEIKEKFQDFIIHETQIIDDHSPRENSIKLASVNKNNELQDHQSDSMETDQLSARTSGSSKAPKSKKPKHSPSDLLRKMSEWVTVETRNFLGIHAKTENPPTNLTDNDQFSIEDEQKKLEKYRWEYIRLCAKLNEEELEDEKYDQMVLNEKKVGQNPKTKKKTNSVLKESKSRTPTQTLTANKIIESEQELSSILNGKNHDQQVESDQSKRVRFNEVVEENSSGEIAQNKIQDQDPGTEESSEVLITPLNDNKHCDVKRRKSFLGILQKNLEEIFEDQFSVYEIGDVLEQIKSLVNTFNLNAQNTDLNWKNHHLATILLLRTLLIFDKLDACKYRQILDSNPMIKIIMELFELTTESMDEMIRKIYTNN